MPAPPNHHSVTFNYVIPGDLNGLLELYSKQNLISSSKLVRRLILEYVEGDRNFPVPPKHPSGKRTSVALTERLLHVFEAKIVDEGHSTKAAVIAALLAQFLPGRVLDPDTETVRVEADLPTDIFSTIYGVYGPGPINEVVVKAMTALANQSKLTKESV